MARRQVGDQPADPAVAHRAELCGDRLEMPVHRELGPRVELAKGAQREGGEIRPQQRVALGRGQGLAQQEGKRNINGLFVIPAQAGIQACPWLEQGGDR